jgi:hypothetical protein
MSKGSDTDSAGEPESFTSKVKSNVPSEAGVPLISPAVGFRDNPFGRDPAVIVHKYGMVPPDATNLEE